MRKLLLLLLFPVLAQAAPSVNTTCDTVTNVNGFTTTYSCDVAAGSDRKILVAVAKENNTGVTLSSVTFGGTAMTLARTKDEGQNQVWIYYLDETNIATGSQDVVITWSASLNFMSSAVVFSDAKQGALTTDPTPPSGTTIATLTSSAFTAAANDIIFGASGSGADTANCDAVTGQTERFDNAESSHSHCSWTKVSSGGSDTIQVTKSGSVNRLILVSALVEGISTSPTVSLDTASQAAGSTWVATLSTALAGGNPTKAVLGTGDEVTCDSATSTTCTFTLPLAQFSNTGTLNNTPWAATTVKLSDGTNESQTTALTITVPSTGLMVDLACTAGVNCDTGSEADSPMTTNDDCAVVVNSGSALSALTTHCQPYFAGPTSNYTVYQFDESATAWLEQDTVNLTSLEKCLLDPYQSPYESPYSDPYYSYTCE